MEKMTKAQERTKTALAVFIDMRHPVAIAVETLREAALDRAEEKAREQIKQVASDLADAKYDLNVCAPYPKGHESRASYMTKLSRYHLFQQLTRWNATTYRPNEPHLASMSDKGCAKFIQTARKEAAWAYDAYVVKLCQKVGNDIEWADCREYVGVWGRSTIDLRRTSGAIEFWTTQQIVNVSKLGTLYNQWPTRKAKTPK